VAFIQEVNILCMQ